MQDFLQDLGIKDVNFGASTGTENGWLKTTGEKITSYSPIDGKPIASITQATEKEYEYILKTAQRAFSVWKVMPAPERGN
ncbi:MAG: aldehyde dehydrogenase family protein, partial [Caldisericia bacterium]|nr:aldehyde dehydrogenase family protein [Caldisericia bacterium]